MIVNGKAEGNETVKQMKRRGRTLLKYNRECTTMLQYKMARTVAGEGPQGDVDKEEDSLTLSALMERREKFRRGTESLET